MKNNKFRNSKKIGLVAMSLAAVSLVTVGFSAWVIAETSTESTDNISVTVGEVKDQTVALTLGGTNGLAENNSVKFDAIVNDEGSVTSTDGGEDMTFEIVFSADLSNGKTFKGVKVAATEATTGTYLTTWAGAEAKYIDLPFKLEKTDSAPNAETFIPLIDSSWTAEATHYVTYGSDFASCTYEDSDTSSGAYDVKVVVSKSVDTVTWNCTFNFHWGTAFGGKNPVLEIGGKTAAQIKDALTAMQHKTAFKLTVTHDPKAEVSISSK